MAKQKTPEQKAQHAERERLRRAANRDEYNAKMRERRREKGEHVRALDRARYEHDPKVRAQKLEAAKRIREMNPEEVAKYQKVYRETNAETLRAYGIARHYRDNYGMTIEQRDEMLVSQGGACAICSVQIAFDKNRSAHVDHCHATGKVRAILCKDCNPGLGWFRDSPELLRAAAAYIEKHRGVSLA